MVEKNVKEDSFLRSSENCIKLKFYYQLIKFYLNTPISIHFYRVNVFSHPTMTSSVVVTETELPATSKILPLEKEFAASLMGSSESHF